MLIIILVASIIPSLIWIVQKTISKTGLRATYIRRRIFAWSLLISFFLIILNLLAFLGQADKNLAIQQHYLVRHIIREVIFGLVVIFNGFKPGKAKNQVRGYWFSIWEAYKPEYMIEVGKRRVLENPTKNAKT